MKIRYCLNCNKVNRKKKMYCTKCGANTISVEDSVLRVLLYIILGVFYDSTQK